MQTNRRAAGFLIGVLTLFSTVCCSLSSSFAEQEALKLTIFPQGLNLVEQTKKIKLTRGVSQLIFGPVSKKIILDSVYPQAEGCEFLEQEYLSDSLISWRVRSWVEGESLLKVVYLTTGLTCRLNYQAKVNEEEGFMDLSGWANIENKSGMDFSQVYLTLKLEAHPQEIQDKSSSEVSSDVSPYFPPDFLSYSISYPVTLKDGEKKRILLFSYSHIPIKKKLLFDGDKYGEEVREELVFENTVEGGVGDFLPSGGVYVYKVGSDGRLSFVGKDILNLVLPGEEGSIYLGRARGVKGEKVQTSYRKLESSEKEYGYRIILYNFRDVPVRVEVVEHFYGEWQVLESQPPNYIRKDNSIVYELEIPAEARQEIQYKARIR